MQRLHSRLNPPCWGWHATKFWDEDWATDLPQNMYMCTSVPILTSNQSCTHIYIYIYIKLCISLLHQFFSANTGTSAVAHASNRDEKCVMRKWCRWCCFSWVASMYTYIYICVCVQLHASIAGKQATYIYIYINLLVSCMPALLASRTYIYIYTHIFIYLSMVVQIYIYICSETNWCLNLNSLYVGYGNYQQIEYCIHSYTLKVYIYIHAHVSTW